MDKRRSGNLSVEGAMRLFRRLLEENPMYLLLGILIPVLWGIEKWVLSVSSWVPLIVAVWAVIQHGNHKHQLAVDDLNRKWKRVALEASPTTSLEHCEWLNKLLIYIWPNYLNPMLNMRLSSIVEKRLKYRRPRLIERIELLEFFLGSSSPKLALEGARWLTVDNQKILRIDVEWDTCGMNILLQAKLAKPLGTARIVINHLFIKGELQLMPILDGKAILFSFFSVPKVDIDVAFGSGSSQSLPATVLPGVSSWLKKLLADTIEKTMVEPRRCCLYLPVQNLRKKAVVGIIHVTVVGANQISQCSLKGSRRQQSYTANGNSEEHLIPDLQTFVEVQLEQLTRRTNAKRGSNPRWDSTFNMVLNNHVGILKFNLYEFSPGGVKHDYLASCEVKLKYCADDSTIFWAIGPNSSAIAKQAIICGQEVEMTVPFEGSASGEISVRLLVKKWQFSDGSNPFSLSSRENIYGSTDFSVATGRKIYVTVAEAKDLARKDKSEKIGSYVKLHYGKAIHRTKPVSDCPVIVWNQTFEFEELGAGEYLTLKCYNEQTFGDEYIGSARVNMEGLVDGLEKEEWVPLEKVNSGDVKLILKAVRMDNNEAPKGSALGSCNGWIELVLVEARDLVAADIVGTSDPYIRVHCGNVKKQTKVVFKSLNPHWHQTLDFVDDGSPLKLYVKDYNPILAATGIGECEIEYQMLPRNQTYDKWIPLQGVKKGEIHVLITRRTPDLKGMSSLDSDSPFEQSQQITSQIKQLLTKLHPLACDGDQEGLSEIVSEIETLQAIQKEHMLQLETERSLLLDKATQLGEEINSSPPTGTISNSTGRSKSLF